MRSVWRLQPLRRFGPRLRRSICRCIRHLPRSIALTDKTDAQLIEEISKEQLPDHGPIGAQIDALWELRERKRALEAQVTEINIAIDTKERALLDTMDQQQTTRGAGEKATVTVRESIVPQVHDWDEFWKFIRRNNAFELLERRPAVAAFREHASRRKDGKVPGVVPFLKRSVSVRTS